jgi:hypothetical protein
LFHLNSSRSFASSLLFCRNSTDLPGGSQTVGRVCTQVPAPSQVLIVHTLAAVGQAVPAGSNVQVAEQQSPFSVLPSSHCSPMFAKPSPQAPTGAKAMPSRPRTVGAMALTLPLGTPMVARKFAEFVPPPQFMTP